MFTGIIEAVGTVKTVKNTHGGRIICVDLGKLAQNTEPGWSIAVNGVCLTVSRLSATVAEFDVSAETLAKSAMDAIITSAKVNLERAISPQGRFGGHFVQGHVDGIGTIKNIEPDRSKYVLWIAAPNNLMQFIIEKGSVAVDGVSLTVVEVKADSFSVSIIPTTLRETNLGRKKTGDKVNLEADLISKWIVKKLDQILPPSPAQPNLTLEKLREKGFA